MRTKWVAPGDGSLHNEIPRLSRPLLGAVARRLRWLGAPVHQEHLSTNRRNHLLVIFGARSVRQSVASEMVPPLVRARRRLI